MTPLFESEETFSSLAAPKDFILLQLQYNPFSGCFLVSTQMKFSIQPNSINWNPWIKLLYSVLHQEVATREEMPLTETSSTFVNPTCDLRCQHDSYPTLCLSNLFSLCKTDDAPTPHIHQLFSCNQHLIDILSTVFALWGCSVRQVIGEITLNI